MSRSSTAANENRDPLGPFGLVTRRVAANYCFTAGTGLATAVVLPLVFFTAGFTAWFLWLFLTGEVEAAGVPLVLVAGLAGVCAANVKGRVAKARAMVTKVVFILFSLRALASSRPLTITSCGRSAGNTIACAGYFRRLIRGWNG